MKNLIFVLVGLLALSVGCGGVKRDQDDSERSVRSGPTTSVLTEKAAAGGAGKAAGKRKRPNELTLDALYKDSLADALDKLWRMAKDKTRADIDDEAREAIREVTVMVDNYCAQQGPAGQRAREQMNTVRLWYGLQLIATSPHPEHAEGREAAKKLINWLQE
ncbi:MAG: hypothetical protein E6G97_18380 [Alphaproteobacteria bacterium]|nr:MAG: hypothetical protein E6G97_18380 [Alphaproteobacteria bacterium]